MDSKQRRKIRAWPAMGIVGVLVGIAACSESDSRTLALRDDPPAPPPAMDAEMERLRQMQQLHVYDTEYNDPDSGVTSAPPVLIQITANNLVDEMPCSGATCGPPEIGDPCAQTLCRAERDVCFAKTAIALTMPQANPPKIGRYVVPAQKVGAYSAVLGYARTYAGAALAEATLALRTMMGYPGNNACSANDISAKAVIASTLFADAYYAAREVIEAAVDYELASADEQMASTSSIPVNASRAISGSDLSRAAAAHLLIGGSPGLHGFPSGFCSTPELDPDAVAALNVLREAAVSPGDLTAFRNGSYPLLDGPTGATNCPSSGSIRERLAELYGSAPLGVGADVAGFLGISEQSFRAAAEYLEQEISAFGRSPTAYLPPRQLPGGDATKCTRYAATATLPQGAPALRYAALARWSDSSFEPPTDFITLGGSMSLGPKSLAELIDAAFAAAATLVKNPGAMSKEGLAPLAVVLNGEERSGRAEVYSNSTATEFYVDGYTGSDGLIVVNGDDGLRCAVTGSIDGMECSIPAVQVATLSNIATSGGALRNIALGPTGGFDVAAGGVASSSPLPDGVYYVVKPKNAISAPGQYEALAGLWVKAPTTGSAWRFWSPVVPWITARVAEILEPSRDWCTRSRHTCTNVSLDDRLPLSDELAPQIDGVESSWKYYLNRAKEAASLADTLGAEYINAGLEQSREVLTQELREEAQLERAEAEVAKFQTACGTDVDPRRVIQLLSSNATQNPLLLDNATKTSGCTPSSLSSCMVDFSSVLGEHVNEPNIRRMIDCLDRTGNDAFVSMGDKPVCLWQSTSNPNSLCFGAQSDQCPTVNFWPADKSCDDLLGTPPLGAVIRESRPLGFFVADRPGGNGAACDALRRLREHPSPDTWESLKAQIVGGDTFNPTTLKDKVGQVVWVADYGGYSRTDKSILDLKDTLLGRPRFEFRRCETQDCAQYQLTGLQIFDPTVAPVDVVPGKFTTGNPWSGPAKSWPCGSYPVTCDGEVALFCRKFDCANETDRAKANQLLLNAVTAADAILGQAPEYTTIIPWPFAPNFTCGDNEPCGASAVRYTHLGTPIKENRCGYHTLGLPADHPARTIWVKPDGTVVKDDCGYVVQPRNETIDLPNGRSSAWTDGLLSGLSNYKADSPGWFVEKLSGSAPEPKHINTYVDICQGDTHCRIADENANFIHPDVIGDDQLLDGLELLCELSKSDDAVMLAIPKVDTVGSLAGLSRYISALGKELHRKAAQITFANMPKAVSDAITQESVIGSYPRFGGTMGVIITKVREGLRKIQETEPLVANEITQLGNDLQMLYGSLQLAKIEKEQANLQLEATTVAQMGACGNAVMGGSITSVFSSYATCATGLAQINIAERMNRLAQQHANIVGDQAKGQYVSQFSARSTNLQNLSGRLSDAVDEVNAALTELENTRNGARAALSRAVFLASYQGYHAAEVSNVIATLYSGKQKRYVDALRNAKTAADIAKRAVEQRLGMSLASMTEDLPLVEAPSSWEASVCTFGGLNYDTLKLGGDAGVDNYSAGFIGDYVRKLENVVESYRMKYNFHEGADTTVISLRDDLLNVRKTCDVAGPNLLYYASSLGTAVAANQAGQKGWIREGCITEMVDGSFVEAPDCISAVALPETLVAIGNAELSSVPGYLIRSGTNATPSAALVQRPTLAKGRYRLSWYAKTGDSDAGASGMAGSTAGIVRGSHVVLDAADAGTAGTESVPGVPWTRYSIAFAVAAEEAVSVGFAVPGTAANDSCTPELPGAGLDAGLDSGRRDANVDGGQTPSCDGGTRVLDAGPDADGGGAVEFLVAAPMLERLPDAAGPFVLTPFANTADTLTTPKPACEDTDGDMFRATQWRRACMRLCPDGYSSQCSGAHAEAHCYREASFNLSQRAIQAGKVLNFAGFARGNFNYRILSIGLNFVGTATRDCSDSTMPTTCYGAGFIPYSIGHNGPLFVRNHLGRDYRAYLFDGRIEHARGLAAERYLTNPLSQTDRQLITPYLRTELQGRPLDGSFVIRVWEEPGVDFEAIKDVQVVVDYKYWTRFQ